MERFFFAHNVNTTERILHEKLNKLLGVLMVAMTIISTLFIYSSTVHASNLVLNEVTVYCYTRISPHIGFFPIFVIMMNNILSFRRTVVKKYYNLDVLFLFYCP